MLYKKKKVFLKILQSSQDSTRIRASFFSVLFHRIKTKKKYQQSKENMSLKTFLFEVIAREHEGTQGTLKCEHVSMQGSLACEHVITKITFVGQKLGLLSCH